LDQPVGERGLAVVDVGDDRKIADVLHRFREQGRRRPKMAIKSAAV
jgi:hypothetical protein